MRDIERNPKLASRQEYDLVVVGGGIYGAMMALEATLRDCSVLLLEKEDFGGATSYNSLRIIHGGLRELRTLNLQRYWTFGRERRWFLEYFPDLVERLPVLVPLYQRGLMRTSVFTLAFLVDRLLLPKRDRRVDGKRAIPYGQVLSSSEAKRLFPSAKKEGLKGGALWYDACVPDSQRLIMEVLRLVCQMGGTALNYTPAVELVSSQGQVEGVRARDARKDESHRFHADTVVNAAGPWSREMAERFGRHAPDLRPCLSAWNVLFDRESPAECAVGAAPSGSGAQHYFLHPWEGRLLVGTGHAARENTGESPHLSQEELDDFLREVNDAFPNLELSRDEILHVYAGHLPAKRRGSPSLSKEETWIDHSDHGGPEGLLSVQGTKFTAARSTAETVMKHLFPDRIVPKGRHDAFRKARSERAGERGVFDYNWAPPSSDSSWLEPLARIVEEEAVVHLDDLVLRRTNLGDNPKRALRVAPRLCDLFDWDEKRRRNELERLNDHFRWANAPESTAEEYV
ncbi:glycerol-3-phosphate dehydrogenase [Salinibacter ruber]|uniref:FAD-dependent oxidoreductase n=1 Tax=Salinibacter ruber TaxID=146919 RepID=UPI0021673316|nr:FAD-dependent oxidoreductase [Salinibacter ruber]MCS3700169.1 glycerol-3-phosphate dehydrogenase [Salinibacter ruber]